jgi:gamma-glutamyl-gamma-aminobutyrate hydrolase PuuD
MKRPVVLITTRRTARRIRYVDYVGELHLELLVRLRTLPLIVPVVRGALDCLPEYMERMNGLLIVEGEDIQPKRYRARGENFRYLEKTDPIKDEIEVRLLRHALRWKVPVLGICRGSQLLNVVCGGTLYGDVRRENRSRLKHIDYDHYDAYRHPINLVPGSPLARFYGRRRMLVNSYHHQGVRELARRFKPMAYADDDLVEAYYDPKADFLMGLQFHPERMLREHLGNLRVWEAFGAAVHGRYSLRDRKAVQSS